MALEYANIIHCMGSFDTIGMETGDLLDGIQCKLQKAGTGKYDLHLDNPLAPGVYCALVTMLGDRGGMDVANWGTYSVKDLDGGTKRFYFADGSNGEPEDVGFMVTILRYPGNQS